MNNEVIETTDNHPFWVEGKGWVTAIDLKVGDPLKQSNGHVLAIEQIEVVHHDQKVKVYNFTVAEYHTYFVSDLGIWVHNIDCFISPPFSISNGKRGKKIVQHLREDWNLPPTKENQDWLIQYSKEIHDGYKEVRINDWRGIVKSTDGGQAQEGPAYFYRKGNDVVITTLEGEFVTILKDGIYNTRFQRGEVLDQR